MSFEGRFDRAMESARRIGESGWLHVLRPSTTAWPPSERTIRRVVRLATEVRDGPDLAGMAGRWRLPADSPQLRRLADSLGLTSLSLFRLRAGWSADRRAWCFPMSDVGGAVLGIRLRRPDGGKLSVKGVRPSVTVCGTAAGLVWPGRHLHGAGRGRAGIRGSAFRA
jgi:hypothetical protein